MSYMKACLHLVVSTLKRLKYSRRSLLSSKSATAANVITVDSNMPSIFRPSNLKFSSTTPTNVQELIKGLLNPIVNQRLAYKNASEILDSTYFLGMFILLCSLKLCVMEYACLGLDWATIGINDGEQVDIQATVDPSSVFAEANLETFSSPIFDQF